MNWSAATHIGGRDYQEDRFVVVEHKRGLLAAVFDGHNGSECAELCKQVLPTLLDNLDRLPLELTHTEMLYTMVLDLDTRTSWMESGTTLSIVLITDPPTIHVAVLGDSPVIVDRSDGLWIAPEHNVRTNSDEMHAAIARGGRDGGDGYLYDPSMLHGLQMSRALGDSGMGKVISSHPEVGTMQMNKWVLLASDGLVDPSHHDNKSNISKLALRLDTGNSAQDLVDTAVASRVKDNVTAIVIRP